MRSLLDGADDAVARLDWETVKARAQAVLAFDPENRDAMGYLQAAELSLPGGASAEIAKEA